MCDEVQPEQDRLALRDEFDRLIGSARGPLDVGGTLQLDAARKVAHPEMMIERLGHPPLGPPGGVQDGFAPRRPLVGEIVFERVADTYGTPFGVREVRFDPWKGFFLNGKSVKMKGVCIHNDAGCLGSAVPVRAWERRLEVLRALGCNAIRMSHNPPAPVWRSSR